VPNISLKKNKSFKELKIEENTSKSIVSNSIVQPSQPNPSVYSLLIDKGDKRYPERKIIKPAQV